jgi:hypothetical protein
MTTNVYADKKWIPIEAINPNENGTSDTNKSKPLPTNKWIDNIKVMQRLLDNTSKDDVDSENKKNWYELNKVEHN